MNSRESSSMLHRTVGGLIAAMVIAASLGGWFLACWAADNGPRRSVGSGIETEPKFDEAAIRDKLQEIQANQQSILEKFDVLKEEVRIIKVRATSRGATQ